jgi:16S rRNA (uracil1498-N3)-methyltransferase
MRLNRVFVQPPLCSGTLLELPPAAAQHLARVLRARIGDEIVLFTGDGREFTGSVESIRGSRVTVAVGDARVLDRESPLAVTLVQCMARADRMDVIVQKTTELGVARIVPVSSRRSVVRLDAGQAVSKLEHWRGIAQAACEQCGRNRLPTIEAPRPLLHHLGDTPSSGARLVLDPDASGAGSMPRIGATVEIAIGPEGGFDPEELDAFRVAGFEPIALGPRVLRTETAAIAALAWLQARYGDLSLPSAAPPAPSR